MVHYFCEDSNVYLPIFVSFLTLVVRVDAVSVQSGSGIAWRKKGSFCSGGSEVMHARSSTIRA